MSAQTVSADAGAPLTAQFDTRQFDTGQPGAGLSDSGQLNTGQFDTGPLVPGTRPAGPFGPAAVFGQGGREPYAGTLVRGMGRLTLRPVLPLAPPAAHEAAAHEAAAHEAAAHEAGVQQAIGPVHFSVGGFSAPATAGERGLLRTLRGPLLDVGCGPGRMLAAAQELGLAAMGVDTSAPAVRLARNRGAAAIHGSVFDPLPHEGGWGSALLLDGNIGIGGNVRALLERVGSLLAPGGQLLVEAESPDSLDLAYLAVLEDAAGRRSDSFPWARVGAAALAGHAARAGLAVGTTRRVQGRVFLALERRA
ncbi:class I SAM-dependent methyltransferase [Pseudarthrobacter sp. P1]|uniref:class I SAM-dependent methyltransferase n=1 Tax=Pseudarthrobacter sp. P1 TaxID=3418418 RepID=UPI003CE99910